MPERRETKGLGTDPARDVEDRPWRRTHMFAHDGIECRCLLSDDGVPVSIDEVVERRDLVVHVRGWKSLPSA